MIDVSCRTSTFNDKILNVKCVLGSLYFIYIFFSVTIRSSWKKVICNQSIFTRYSLFFAWKDDSINAFFGGLGHTLLPCGTTSLSHNISSQELFSYCIYITPFIWHITSRQPVSYEVFLLAQKIAFQFFAV